MRIAFVIPSLGAGGYEQVVVNYANELAGRGHSVVVLHGGSIEKCVFELRSDVELVPLGGRARYFLPPLIRFLKDTRVDVLYSGLRIYNVLTVAANRLAGSKALMCASQHGFERQPWLLSRLMGRIIGHANILTATSPELAAYEAKALDLPLTRFLVLRNPAVRPASTTERQPVNLPWIPGADELTIVVVGRLAPVKRIDIALRIFQGVQRRRAAKLIVVGDGPDRDRLMVLAMQLGLSNNAHFTGWVANPVDYIAKATVLLHTAETEGFGNVVAEALSVEVPVVCTSCSGPPYIIGHGRFGIDIGRADDANTVPAGIAAILDIADGRAAFRNLRGRAFEFSVPQATDQFEQLVEEEVARR